MPIVASRRDESGARTVIELLQQTVFFLVSWIQDGM
jgi:hypothetical protein